MRFQEQYYFVSTKISLCNGLFSFLDVGGQNPSRAHSTVHFISPALESRRLYSSSSKLACILQIVRKCTSTWLCALLSANVITHNIQVIFMVSIASVFSSFLFVSQHQSCCQMRHFLFFYHSLWTLRERVLCLVFKILQEMLLHKMNWLIKH